MEIFNGTEATIMALPRPEIGEVAKSTDTNRMWQYTEKGWTDITDSANISMNIYDMNKQVIAQLPSLCEENIISSIGLINSYVYETNNIHYMLYGKEISYFTIFQRIEGLTETVGEAVIDCLHSVGEIKSIDLTPEKDAFEIWVMYQDEATCLYLFPYDAGIVQVGG